MTPEIRRALDERLHNIERLAKVEENYKTAQQERQRAEQAAQQRERAGSQIFANAEREISSLRARAEAVSLNAGAAAELVMYERLLQQLRSSGNEPGQWDLVRIRALASEYGRGTEQLAAYQQELRATGEVGNVVAGGLSQAFANFTRTGKADFKDMVASMLADLAQLMLQKNVLQPLFGGGGMGGGGDSGLFGTLLGSIFGGFRANGGDVDAGRAYVVGERGPELFIPKNIGTILPNGAQAGGRTGGDINVYVHGTPELDARVESTVEGAVVRRAPAIVSASVDATRRAMPALIDATRKRSM